jgi:16S rRNA processing protein RimM
MPGEWIAIAVVKRPVGLEGYCAVEPFGDTFSALPLPCQVRLGKELDRARVVTVTKIVALPKEYRCRFAEAADRTAAEGFRGQQIFIEQGALRQREAGKFYHFELKGLAVFGDQDGGLLGTVIDVHNFPSVDTLEVKLTGGETVLLPLMDLAIAAIDIAAGRITARQTYIREVLD